MIVVTGYNVPGLCVPEFGVLSATSPRMFGEVLATSPVNPGSAVWPAANRALFLPFEVWSPVVIDRAGVANGATAAGNLDVGIYDINGNRLVSSGSVAQAGTSTLQEINLTDTLLAPGNYFAALVLDGITGTVLRWSSQVVQYHGLAGMVEMATAFPLPNPATFATPPTAIFIPAFGLSMRSAF